VNASHQPSLELKLVRSVGLEERFAIDIGSVRAGHRALGLLHVEASSAAGVKDGLKLLGLEVVATRFLTRERDPSSRESLLKFPRRSADGTAFAPHEWAEIWFSRIGAETPDADTLFGDPGMFLGYPPCCVQSFGRIVGLSSHYRRYLVDARPRHWELNRLTALFGRSLLTPDFFPCALDCDAALRFCRPLLGVAADVLGSACLSDWISVARQPIVTMSGAVCTFSDWRIVGDCLEVSAASGTKVPIDAIGAGLTEHVPDRPWLVPFTHLATPATGSLPTKLAVQCGASSTVVLELAPVPMSTASADGVLEC
jgi:hypothetical protein